LLTHEGRLPAETSGFFGRSEEAVAIPVILATSRQPLDLPGEVVFRVLPLDVADDGGDAVALFADRAGAAVPGFAAGSVPAAQSRSRAA
jgi:predicted ATPase